VVVSDLEFHKERRIAPSCRIRCWRVHERTGFGAGEFTLLVRESHRIAPLMYCSCSLSWVRIKEPVCTAPRRLKRGGMWRKDVLRTLASDLAQAIYLFIPSRAAHHPKEDPCQ
jgi:hypothetical protein